MTLLGQIDWTPIVKAKNRYAGFWEWPEKRLKELGVAEEIIPFIESSIGSVIAGYGNVERDPPDVWLRTTTGLSFGLEITELVDKRRQRWLAEIQDMDRERLLCESL